MIFEKQDETLVDKFSLEQSWRENFVDLIGKDIVEDYNNIYLFDFITEQGELNYEVKGTRIINQCWEYLKDVDAVRIDLKKSKAMNDEKKSFIIARY